MSIALAAAAAAAAAIAPADCEALKASALPAIEHANGDFVRALKAQDAQAIAAAYAEEGVFVLPDGRLLVGPAAVAELYAQSAARAAGAIQDGGIETHGLACGGPDLLYEWGRGWLRLRDADGVESQGGGAYLTVWRKVGAEWRIVRNLAF